MNLLILIINLMDELQKIFTPLHEAAARDSIDVAELLIRAGADVNIRIDVSTVQSPLSH